MITPWDFIVDLQNPMLAFLPRALAVSMMSAVMCGVVGAHVVLRGMSFVGDAVAHAVFPGLAVAFLVGGSLVLGGVIAGVTTAVLVALFSQQRRVREDSIIGVFFVTAFAIGIVVISQAPGYSGSLTNFLFGSLVGVSSNDVVMCAVFCVLIIALLAVFNKEFVAVALDRELARAAGLPVLLLDIALYVLVTLSVVLSVQTMGNVLVLALLVIPAATARMITDNLLRMMLWSAGLGAAASFVGIYLSWSVNTPTGGTIVLVSATGFFLAWAFGPQHGMLGKLLARRERTSSGANVSTSGLGSKRICK